jgi:hypothetical protein
MAAYWAKGQAQNDRLLESIAPDSSIACYVGLRF